MDFDAAETFLKRMRAAHEGGDAQMALACRKMICVALEIPEPYDPRLTAHAYGKPNAYGKSAANNPD